MNGRDRGLGRCLGKRFLDGRNSKCKGFGVGMCLVCLKNSEVVRVIRIKRGRVVGDESER